MVVKYIISRYCKTNGNSFKNLYIKKQFINNLVCVATTQLFISPVVLDTKYNYRKRNNNTSAYKSVLEWLSLTYCNLIFLICIVSSSYFWISVFKQIASLLFKPSQVTCMYYSLNKWITFTQYSPLRVSGIISQGPLHIMHKMNAYIFYYKNVCLFINRVGICSVNPTEKLLLYYYSPLTLNVIKMVSLEKVADQSRSGEETSKSRVSSFLSIFFLQMNRKMAITWLF